jgi:CheY-like chemotaxis protein
MAPKLSSVGTTPIKSAARSVLIVEDDVDVLHVIKEVIEAQGYRAIGVENGKQALAVLEEEKPALMLIDLFMPVMSGGELLKVVKRNPQLSAIPRVIMTAANDQMIGIREDVPVLYKPVDFDALTLLLQKYCETPRARQR